MTLDQNDNEQIVTIRLTIRYDGTNYAGWQIQPNARTIQGIIQDCLHTILKKKCHITGAGRTDAGVHAMAQEAHFNTKTRIPVGSLKAALNSTLPKDIAIINIKKETPDFHARKNAIAKKYIYRIYRAKTRNPFLWNYSWHLPGQLNIHIIRECLPILQGVHDFASFSVVDNESKNGTRNLIELNLLEENDMLIFTFLGDSFLRKQIRRIVGTLIDTGRGRFTKGEVIEMLKKRDPRVAGPTAPSKGLFLVKVYYEDGVIC